MTSYWLTTPQEPYDSVRTEELEKMGLFTLPLETKLALRLRRENFPAFRNNKIGILCYSPESIYVPLGNKVLIHDSSEDGYKTTTAVADVRSVSAGPIEELVYNANKKQTFLLFEEGLCKEYDNLSPEDIGSCIFISGFNLKPSDREVAEIMQAAFRYNLTRHQKD